MGKQDAKAVEEERIKRVKTQVDQAEQKATAAIEARTTAIMERDAAVKRAEEAITEKIDAEKRRDEVVAAVKQEIESIRNALSQAEEKRDQAMQDAKGVVKATEAAEAAFGAYKQKALERAQKQIDEAEQKAKAAIEAQATAEQQRDVAEQEAEAAADATLIAETERDLAEQKVKAAIFSMTLERDAAVRRAEKAIKDKIDAEKQSEAAVMRI